MLNAKHSLQQFRLNYCFLPQLEGNHLEQTLFADECFLKKRFNSTFSGNKIDETTNIHERLKFLTLIMVAPNYLRKIYSNGFRYSSEQYFQSSINLSRIQSVARGRGRGVANLFFT